MEVAILAVIFGTIFGVFYLFFSTRNKERLALIEKGADASIFMSSKKRSAAPFWKVLILNLGLLAMGVGVGILLGTFLSYHFGYEGTWENRPQNAIDSGVFYAASIFLCAGGSLLIGFNQTKKLDTE
jgi:membrane associated rhomboid family serine protease